MTRIPYLFVIFVASGLHLDAGNCPVGGVTVFFGNGVNTTFDKALGSMNELDTLVRLTLGQSQSIDQSCIVPALAYDSALGQGNGFWQQVINIAVQAGLISSVQVASQFLPQFPAWLTSPLTSPSWFAQALAVLIASPFPMQPSDLQSHVNLYTNEIGLGNKVIVVSHSQGNLYVNDAYSLIIPPPNSNTFSIVGVATPANFVAGGGPYITLENDIITLVPGHLASNTTNNPLPGAPCSTSINPFTYVALRVACHYFDSSYLPGVNSGPKILDAVIAAIPVPLGITKTGSGSGQVTSVPPGIDCGQTCIAAFPLLTNGNNTSVTLTATEDAASSFTSWSGACVTLGTINGKTITFPIINSSAITSFPEDCTATFGLASVLTVTKSGSGTGTVSSVPAGINCGPACTTPQMAPFPAAPPVQLTAAAASGSTFMGWSGDCTGMALSTTVSVTANKTCTATFGGQVPAILLNPFGNQSGAGPYNVEVVDQNLMSTAAPQDITVTLLRDVISQCSGLLFSSIRTVVVSQGQSSAAYNFNAGRDPACNTLPITTQYTVTQAVLGASTVLDLSGVPAQQLVLAVTR